MKKTTAGLFGKLFATKGSIAVTALAGTVALTGVVGGTYHLATKTNDVETIEQPKGKVTIIYNDKQTTDPITVNDDVEVKDNVVVVRKTNNVAEEVEAITEYEEATKSDGRKELIKNIRAEAIELIRQVNDDKHYVPTDFEIDAMVDTINAVGGLSLDTKADCEKCLTLISSLVETDSTMIKYQISYEYQNTIAYSYDLIDEQTYALAQEIAAIYGIPTATILQNIQYGSDEAYHYYLEDEYINYGNFKCNMVLNCTYNTTQSPLGLTMNANPYTYKRSMNRIKLLTEVKKYFKTAADGSLVVDTDKAKILDYQNGNFRMAGINQASGVSIYDKIYILADILGVDVNDVSATQYLTFMDLLDDSDDYTDEFLSAIVYDEDEVNFKTLKEAYLQTINNVAYKDLKTEAFKFLSENIEDFELNDYTLPAFDIFVASVGDGFNLEQWDMALQESISQRVAFAKETILKADDITSEVAQMYFGTERVSIDCVVNNIIKSYPIVNAQENKIIRNNDMEAIETLMRAAEISKAVIDAPEGADTQQEVEVIEIMLSGILDYAETAKESAEAALAELEIAKGMLTALNREGYSEHLYYDIVEANRLASETLTEAQQIKTAALSDYKEYAEVYGKAIEEYEATEEPTEEEKNNMYEMEINLFNKETVLKSAEVELNAATNSKNAYDEVLTVADNFKVVAEAEKTAAETEVDDNGEVNDNKDDDAENDKVFDEAVINAMTSMGEANEALSEIEAIERTNYQAANALYEAAITEAIYVVEEIAEDTKKDINPDNINSTTVSQEELNAIEADATFAAEVVESCMDNMVPANY